MDEILCNKLSFFLRKSDEKIQENVQITKNVEKKRVKSFHINMSVMSISLLRQTDKRTTL